MTTQPEEGQFYPCSFSGKLLQLVQIRANGNNVYKDHSDGSMTICQHAALSAYPARTAPFAPVEANYASA